MTILALATFFFEAPFLVGLILFLLLFGLLYTDKYGWATVVLFLAVGLVVIGHYVKGVEVNWWLLSLGTVAYIVAGFAFTWPKWFWSYVPKKTKEWADFKTNWEMGATSRRQEYVTNYVLNNATFQGMGQDRTNVSRGGLWGQSAEAEVLTKKYQAEVAEASKEFADSKEDERQLVESWNVYHSSNLVKIRRTSDDSAWDVYYDRWALSARLSTWIIHWPIYAMLMVFEDLIRNIIDYLITHLGAMFSAGASKAFNQA